MQTLVWVGMLAWPATATAWESEASAEASADVAPAIVEDDVGANDRTPSARVPSFTESRRAELERELLTIAKARPGLAMPLLTASTGAAAMLAGVVLGVGVALPCEGRCTATSAAAVLVTSGAAVLAAGAVWLKRTYDTVRAFDRRRTYLRSQLQWLTALD